MSLISSAGNNFANIATLNINIDSNKNFQSNPQNNTQVRNPDAPQAIPQKDKSTNNKQDGNIAGSFGSAKSANVNTTPENNLTTSNFAEQKIDSKVLQEALDKIQQHLVLNENTALKFEVDEDSGKQLVKMIDKSNDNVIRQIPSETALQIATAVEELFKIKEGIILSEEI